MELIRKRDALHAVLHHQGDAAVAAVQNIRAVDAVPVDFINQKIVELQSCADQHFNDGHEILATCVWETIRLLGGIVKEWRGKEQTDADN